MQWFKFYGQDFLTDPKIMELNVIERSLWITLLCLYSSNGGRPLKITVDKLKLFSGMEYTDAQIWKMADQSLTHFEALKMITNDNEMITLTAFQRRQNTQLSPYERIKKFREKNKVQAKPSYKMITNDNEMITQGNVINDNARIDKKRIYKKEIDKEKENPHAQEFLGHYNRIFHKTLTSTRSWGKNLADWLEVYSVSDMVRALEIAHRDKFWKDKITPEMLLRRKNPQGEQCDRIQEMLARDQIREDRPKIFISQLIEEASHATSF